jgi:putative hemolysin
MSVYASITILVLASLASLYFSTLSYALREFSRTKLAEYLGRHGGDRWFEALTEQTDQFVFVTAVFRQISNLVIFITLFAAFDEMNTGWALRYGGSALAAAMVSLFCSIALPQVIAKYAAEPAIGISAPLLSFVRTGMRPLTLVMTMIDNSVKRTLGVNEKPEPEEIEQEILSAVEEGESQGVVDEQERELIENVIDLRDTTAGHIMTARPDMVAIEVTASLDESRELLESSGHSRLPVYEGTLDRIVGILFARDLIKFLGRNVPFQMRSSIRPAMFVPETKPLRDLLTDFRQQKLHIAIVLDEYGGTAGLVTIEDVLEELVGEIADEHEPIEPAMLKRLSDGAAEADARLPVSELNRHLALSLPENAGYETLGGFLSTSLGRIPEKGTVYEAEHARFTVLDAEPRKVNRVKIELLAKASK